MTFLRVMVLASALHGYVAWRLLPALGPVAGAALAVALLLSWWLVPLGLMARRVAPPPLADALTWVGMTLMGWFSSLWVLTLLRDGVGAVWLGAAWLWPALDASASLAQASAQAVLAAALGMTLWGFVYARRTPPVRYVEVAVAGLPPALHGLKVVQITDLHVGATIQHRFVRRVVRRVNALHADLVAVTGDMVDGRVAELAAHVAPLAQLQSRHGTFFVTGNHEYYAGVQPWLAQFERLGFRILMNEHVVLEHCVRGLRATLVVAGVADWSAELFDPAHRSDAQAAMRGAPASAGVRLLLAHQPRSAPAAAEAGFDLQLSGHTHGGQFWPWNHLVRLQQPFVAGLHKVGPMWVYTSRGAGYWGPPQRFGAPSEITCVSLVPA